MSEKPTPQEAEKLQELLTKLDLADVAFALSQLALKIVSGKAVEEKSYQVTVSLPVEIVQVFEKLAEAGDVPVEKLLSSFAKEGFNKAVKGRLEEAQKDQQVNQPEAMQNLESMLPNFGPGLMQGLEKIKQMADQLGHMQKVVENVVDTTGQKDNQQPSVPDGTPPQSKTGE